MWYKPDDALHGVHKKEIMDITETTDLLTGIKNDDTNFIEMSDTISKVLFGELLHLETHDRIHSKENYKCQVLKWTSSREEGWSVMIGLLDCLLCFCCYRFP